MPALKAQQLPPTASYSASAEAPLQQQRRRDSSSSFSCFLFVTNTILVLAVGVALWVCVVFLHDEPLYEYGEQLLSLRFYRHIVYNCVVVPLALFVPIYYFLGSFLSARASSSLKNQKLAVSEDTANLQRETTRLRVFKIVYAVCVAFLVLVGLVFVFPSSRYSAVAVLLETQLRKHLDLRFQNDISYRFIDAIQRHYRCCDLMWYRQRQLHAAIPISCYNADTFYTRLYEDDCADTLASLVSNRCIYLSLALATILLMLIFLITVDIFSLVSRANSLAGQTYNVAGEEEEAKRRKLRRPQHDDIDNDFDSTSDGGSRSPASTSGTNNVPARKLIATGNHSTSTLFRNVSPRPPSTASNNSSARFPTHSILKNAETPRDSFKSSFPSTSQPSPTSPPFVSGASTSTCQPPLRRPSLRDGVVEDEDDDDDFDNDNDSADRDYEADIIDNIFPKLDSLPNVSSSGVASDPLLTHVQVFDTPVARPQTPTRFKTVSSSSTTTEMFEERRKTTLTSHAGGGGGSGPKPAPLVGLWSSRPRSISFLADDDNEDALRKVTSRDIEAGNEIGLPRVSRAYTIDSRRSTTTTSTPARPTSSSSSRPVSRSHSPSDAMAATRRTPSPSSSNYRLPTTSTNVPRSPLGSHF